jgi:hypothetical protein
MITEDEVGGWKEQAGEENGCRGKGTRGNKKAELEM